MTNYKNIENVIDEHLNGKGGFTRHYLTLFSLVVGMESKKVLELGAGFSSRVILTALEQTGGKLITCDNRSVEKKGLTDAMQEHSNIWEYNEMNSRDFLPKLKNEKFDLVLHDGAHDFKNVILDLRKIVPKVRRNGLIVVHDTFHPGLQRRFLITAVKIGMFPHRYEMVTLPYGCGLSIIRKKSGKKSEAFEAKWSKNNTNVLIS